MGVAQISVLYILKKGDDKPYPFFLILGALLIIVVLHSIVQVWQRVIKPCAPQSQQKTQLYND